jgi:hypothetical protein
MVQERTKQQTKTGLSRRTEKRESSRTRRADWFGHHLANQIPQLFAAAAAVVLRESLTCFFDFSTFFKRKVVKKII